jgi:hypothetical protein
MPSQDHVGRRFQLWIGSDEPDLSADQKAAAYETFAIEFESLPASREPSSGWAATMADLCRRIARHHRGGAPDATCEGESAGGACP